MKRNPALVNYVNPAVWFAAFFAASLVLFRAPLAALTSLGWHDDRYSYIVAVPFISAFLFWLKRDQILADSRPTPKAIPLLMASLLLGIISPVAGKEVALTLQILALVLTWLAVGVCCYGTRALRVVLFPALFLLFLVPLPGNIMDAMAVALQKGSAECTAFLFRVIGMPFSRSGFTFALPGVNIVVAEECSGIRSSISMFISAIVAGYLFLKTGWSRIGLALLTIPVVIFKNAVRIATLSWLGVRIDPAYFTGNLHHYGGLPFTMLVLVILAPVFLAFQKWERNPEPVVRGR